MSAAASRLQPVEFAPLGRCVWRFSLLMLFTALCCAAATAADLEPAEIQRLWLAGQYAECAAQADKASQAAPWNESLRVLRLRALLELGQYAEALEALDEAIEQFPNSVQLRIQARDVYRFNKQADRVAAIDEEIAKLLKRLGWQYSDSANQVAIGRWMLAQGTDAKAVLTGVYNEARRRQPASIDVVLAIGELALGKHDYKLAGDNFQQALKLDAKHPDAQYGLARAFAQSDERKAEQALAAALKINPQHTASLLMVADEHINSERYAQADEALAKVLSTNKRHPLALAYRAVIAHLGNQPLSEKLYHQTALADWPENPEVDHLIGRKLSQHYRFAEGAEYQRRALLLDADYLPAKSQLAQDLLRLGLEDAGLELAEEVYTADGYNVMAHNLVTLQENLARFRTLEADGLVVRMDAREAEIYGEQVLRLLTRARRELCAKYDVQLTQPITVELFPKQQDFAIRTFGLPGGAGFLGVCFGTVITANSPAALGANRSCWEATLWHEFCHVVTLNKTKNKMPRWLSEGISVYEERQADPTWGQSINPRYREMILGDDLTPVSQLSGAFLSPKSPLHLQFAYYESSLVVEYLVEKYGLKTLERVLVDLGVGMPINQSLARYAGSLDALDAEFAVYAREVAEALGPQADWSKPELSPRATADEIAAWLKEHPQNWAALGRLADKQMEAKNWPAAQETLLKMCELHPQDGSGSSPWKLLGKVYREMADTAGEREVFNRLVALTATDLEAWDRLAELAADAGEWELSRKFATRILAVNPLLPAAHRRVALAADKLDDTETAVGSYRALLVLDSFGAAQTHFQLAQSLHKQGELGEARKHALLALEEAPRYRDAQKLLLTIVAADPRIPPVDKPAVPADKPPADKPPADMPPAASPPAATSPPPAPRRPQ